jgi:hypothetical protein
MPGAGGGERERTSAALALRKRPGRAAQTQGGAIYRGLMIMPGIFGYTNEIQVMDAEYLLIRGLPEKYRFRDDRFFVTLRMTFWAKS